MQRQPDPRYGSARQWKRYQLGRSYVRQMGNIGWPELLYKSSSSSSSSSSSTTTTTTTTACLAGGSSKDGSLDNVGLWISNGFPEPSLEPHPQLITHEICACGKDVDTLGVHMQKCKLDGNLTNNTHNRLVTCVAEMARSCCQSFHVEVSGIFNNVDPSSHNRMD